MKSHTAHAHSIHRASRASRLNRAPANIPAIPPPPEVHVVTRRRLSVGRQPPEQGYPRSSYSPISTPSKLMPQGENTQGAYRIREESMRPVIGAHGVESMIVNTRMAQMMDHALHGTPPHGFAGETCGPGLKISSYSRGIMKSPVRVNHRAR